MSKNTINWIFNQTDSRKAVPLFNARSFTKVEAIITIKPNTEYKTIATYTKMVEYGSQEANQKLIEWIKGTVENTDTREYLYPYIYFRFTRK